MRKILLTAAAFGLATTFSSAPALADDHAAETPEMAKKDWYEIVHIKFHSGKMREAMGMIEAFQKVDEALGRDGALRVRVDPLARSWSLTTGGVLLSNSKLRDCWCRAMAPPARSPT